MTLITLGALRALFSIGSSWQVDGMVEFLPLLFVTFGREGRPL